MARALVTGARRGIGREIVLLLARAGHNVVATMRSTDNCDLADIAAREKLSITVAKLDVDDDGSADEFFATLIGSEPIDILINNAGDTCAGQRADHQHLVDLGTNGTIRARGLCCVEARA